MKTHSQRLDAARLALEGLSVGDALARGRMFSKPVWQPFSRDDSRRTQSAAMVR
jgi:hypothetical protein